MKFTSLLAWFALFATLVACNAASTPPPVPTAAPTTAPTAAVTAAPTRPQTLRIELSTDPDVSDLPRLMAADQLGAMGYTLETFNFADNSLSVGSLAQGTLDIGYVSNGIAWAAIQKGAPLVTFLDAVRDPRVFAANAKIQSCADLDGKKVAVPSTSSTQALMVKLYVAKHCPNAKIELAILSSAKNRLLGIVKGDLDAGITDYDLLDDYLKQGKTDVHSIASFTDEFPTLRGSSQVTRREFVEKYPQTIKDYIRAVLVARRQLQDPQVFADQLVKYFKMTPPDAFAKATSYLKLHVWDVNGGLSPEALQTNLDFFAEAGAIKPGLKPTDVAAFTYLNAVLDEIGRK